jgi:hypothetical protein
MERPDGATVFHPISSHRQAMPNRGAKKHNGTYLHRMFVRMLFPWPKNSYNGKKAIAASMAYIL